MLRANLLIVIFFVPLLSFSKGELKYSFEDIPDFLKKDVDVVYRLHKGEFSIDGLNKTTFKVHKVVTILNKNGNNESIEVLHYDDLSKIVEFKGNVYDKNGKLIRKLKNNDIIDRSNISGFSLYEDNRIKAAELSQNQFPYTVEYSYTIKYKYTFHLPDWYVSPNERSSIEKSVYTISAPVELFPRIKLVNTTQKPELDVVEGGIKKKVWEFTNVTKTYHEPYSRIEDNLGIVISLAPNEFQYEDYKGDMATWEGFNNWILTLNKDRDKLDNNAIEDIVSKTKNLDRKQKIEAVYKYMQSNTRYVSIQLGIGGFQPFEASVTHSKGYGDCKALTNYTKALLKQIGINSYYTLVFAGDNPRALDSNFPNSTFNHVILCVPNESDTVWLECTSQTQPFNFLGSFTSNREAFVINEEGGKIVRTPFYGLEENQKITKGKLKIENNGNAFAELKIEFLGIGTETKGVSYLSDRPTHERKKWLEKYIDIPDFQVSNFKFSKDRKELPSVSLNIEMSVRDAGSVSGNRLFLRPNFISKMDFIPEKTRERNNDIYIDQSVREIDSLKYELPENLHPEFLPQPVFIESPFGTYKNEYEYVYGKLIYTRSFELNYGTYPPEKYEEFINFFKSIKKADKKKVVLISKT